MYALACLELYRYMYVKTDQPHTQEYSKIAIKDWHTDLPSAQVERSIYLTPLHIHVRKKNQDVSVGLTTDPTEHIFPDPDEIS